MKNKKNNFPIGELNNSASPNKAVPNEKDLNIYNRKKALIKMGAIGALLIVMIIFGTISWFTQNRQVESSGMTIKTATLPFDIATKGSSVRNQSEINAKRPEYVEGSSGTYSNLSGTSDTYYTGDSLCLRFDPVDDPSTTDVNEALNPPDMAPGSSGELNLFVIPKVDTALNVKVSINVVAFAEVEKKNNNETVYKKDDEGEYITDAGGNKIPDTEIVEITNAQDFSSAVSTKTNNTVVASEASAYVDAASYLRGHILFFGGEGDTENSNARSRYYFTSPYIARTDDSQITFNYPIPSNKNGKAVQVPIYWMWTNTLGQIALKNNDSDKMNGISVVQNLTSEQISSIPNDPLTDKEKIIQYVKNNKDVVLKDWDDMEFTAEELLQTLNTNENPKTLSQVVDGMIDNFDNTNNFSRLSKCYNAADNDIGTKIRYFMIEVTIESAQ